MSTRFVPTKKLTDEDRKEISAMTGKIILYMLEGRRLTYVSEQLKMSPEEVLDNVYEMLYTIRNKIGRRNYFRVLFRK